MGGDIEGGSDYMVNGMGQEKHILEGHTVSRTLTIFLQSKIKIVLKSN